MSNLLRLAPRVRHASRDVRRAIRFRRLHQRYAKLFELLETYHQSETRQHDRFLVGRLLKCHSDLNRSIVVQDGSYCDCFSNTEYLRMFLRMKIHVMSYPKRGFFHEDIKVAKATTTTARLIPI